MRRPIRRSQSTLPVSASSAIGEAAVVDEVELAADVDRRELEQRPLGEAPEFAEGRLDPLRRQVAGAGAVEPVDRPVDRLRRLRLRRLLRLEGRRLRCGRRRGASAARRRATAPLTTIARRRAARSPARGCACQSRSASRSSRRVARAAGLEARPQPFAAARRSDSLATPSSSCLIPCLTHGDDGAADQRHGRRRAHRVDHPGAAAARGQLDGADVVAHRQARRAACRRSGSAARRRSLPRAAAARPR